MTILDTFIFLHEKNIAHRDLKPANILLDEQDQPKLCDLGMAKWVGTDKEMSFRTDVNGAMGTPGYMPPEMTFIKKGEHYSPKAWDVFSMAMLIYFMWSGKHPLLEFEQGFAINEEISKGTRPLLPTRMPSELRDIVRMMWAQKAHERLSMGEAFKLLNRCFGLDDNIEDGDGSLKGSSLEMNPILIA